MESISFRADSGFTVAELEYGNELVTIVGELTDVAQGEELTLTGYYVTHPRYGSQFKVMMFERRLPLPHRLFANISAPVSLKESVRLWHGAWWKNLKIRHWKS